MMKKQNTKIEIESSDYVLEIVGSLVDLLEEEILPDFISFIESSSGKSENYLLKKEKNFIREIFSQILLHFKTGKITPPGGCLAL